jgi:hypothetical protein
MHLRTSVVVRLTTFAQLPLAIAALLAAAAPAAATPLAGPVYPLPWTGVTLHGGDVCVSDGGTPGSATVANGTTPKGTTWTFGSGTPTSTTICPTGTTTPAPFATAEVGGAVRMKQFARAYWGIDGTAARSPRVAMDGSYTPPAEILATSTDSNPAAGLLVWTGATTFQGCLAPCSNGVFTAVNAQTRMELRVTTLASAPVSLVPQADAGIGLPLTQAVVAITPALTNFKVNVRLLARLAAGGGNFEPAETFHNRWYHQGGGEFISSFSGAFWYQNRLPDADFTYSTPQANVPITFNADYADADGEINTIGWDFDGDGSFAELDKPSGQWAFPAGTYTVRFRVNDEETPAEYTVVAKDIVVPPGPDVTPLPTVAPPPPTDADGDGYPAALDCNDRNAAIHPGVYDTPGNGVDEDCVAGAAMPQTMIASVTWSHNASRTGTTFAALTIKNVTPGSTIAVRCKGKKCPKALTLRNAGGTVNLKTFTKKKLPVKDVIEIRITHDGYIGLVKTLTIRKGKAPLAATLCLPPGATKPVKCT